MKLHDIIKDGNLHILIDAMCSKVQQLETRERNLMKDYLDWKIDTDLFQFNIRQLWQEIAEHKALLQQLESYWDHNSITYPD